MWNVVAKECIREQHLILTMKQCQMHRPEKDLKKIWNTYTAMIQKKLRKVTAVPKLDHLSRNWMNVSWNMEQLRRKLMSMSLWYCILAVMEQGSSCLCAKDFHFGYKMWYLNYPSGYLLAFDVYQGSKRQNTDSKDIFGVVGQNVLFLID